MRRPEHRSTRLRRLAPLAVVGAALFLTGCQTQSPVQTDVAYVPADGVPVDLGEVQIRDLVVIADKKGGPGILSGSVVNTGGTNEQVSFAGEGGQPVSVASTAYQVERISEKTPVQLPSVSAGPGDMVTLNVRTGAAGTAVVLVPVIPPQGYYETLRPTQAPTQSPTGSPTTSS